MKKILFAALAVAIGFTSCSKDSDSTPDGSKAKIQILLNQANYTRAHDQIGGDGVTQTAVSVQDDLYVIIAQGDAIKIADDVSTTGTVSPAYTKDDSGADLTTSIDKVIILGNLPNGVTGAQVMAQTSVAALKTLLNKGLAVAETDYLAGKIWVQGEAAVTGWTANSTGIQEASVTVDLAPVLSRVDATVNMSAAEGVYTSVGDLQTALSSTGGSALVVEGVALIYSAHESTMVAPFTPTTGTGSVLVSGLTPEAGSSWEASDDKGKATLFTGAESFLKGTWLGTSAWGTPTNPNASGENVTGNSATNAGTFTRSFYAFSPKNYEASTGTGHFISDETGYKATPILVVYGSRYSAAGVKTTPIYFSFRFDDTDMTAAAGLGTAAPEMTPGVRYGINLTFTGDFSTKGSVDPEKPVEYGAALTVTINPAKWSAFVEIGKDFQGD